VIAIEALRGGEAMVLAAQGGVPGVRVAEGERAGRHLLILLGRGVGLPGIAGEVRDRPVAHLGGALGAEEQIHVEGVGMGRRRVVVLERREETPARRFVEQTSPVPGARAPPFRERSAMDGTGDAGVGAVARGRRRFSWI